MLPLLPILAVILGVFLCIVLLLATHLLTEKLSIHHTFIPCALYDLEHIDVSYLEQVHNYLAFSGFTKLGDFLIEDEFTHLKKKEPVFTAHYVRVYLDEKYATTAEIYYCIHQTQLKDEQGIRYKTKRSYHTNLSTNFQNGLSIVSSTSSDLDLFKSASRIYYLTKEMCQFPLLIENHLNHVKEMLYKGMALDTGILHNSLETQVNLDTRRSYEAMADKKVVYYNASLDCYQFKPSLPFLKLVSTLMLDGLFKKKQREQKASGHILKVDKTYVKFSYPLPLQLFNVISGLCCFLSLLFLEYTPLSLYFRLGFAFLSALALYISYEACQRYRKHKGAEIYGKMNTHV